MRNAIHVLAQLGQLKLMAIGELISEDGLSLTITHAAEVFGISRKALSTIINGRAGINPEMAIRLSISLKTSPESWLNMQQNYGALKKTEKH